jgi:hypothetical protein
MIHGNVSGAAAGDNAPVGHGAKEMNVFSFVFLMGCQLAAGLNVVVPAYPANAAHGGNVAAVIEFSKGAASRVVILYADEPFVEPTRTALAQWRVSAERKDKPALVVVNFREPFLSVVNTGHGIKLEPQSHRIDSSRYDRSMPVPKLVVDPFYSDASLVVMGASVLHLEVTESGSVGEVEVIQALGDYTQATVEAVKKWSFVPARNETDRPVASDAFGICVYRPLQNLREP